MKKRRTVDRWFFIAALTLTIVGFFIFISASLGLMAKEGPAYSDIVINQFFIGLLGGLTLLFITTTIHYTYWRQYAFYIFLFSIILTALIYVPGLGIEHGGSTRWLNIGSFSFQPAEALKLGFIVYLSAWLASVRKYIYTYKYGLIPFFLILSIVGILLLLQPDNDTFAVIALAGLAMFFVSGARWSHIAIIITIGILAFGGLVIARPYVMDRVMTYINPSIDPLGSSYQIKQSLIAIGSGEITGRGFGQSIQKFNFLPEPIGDSIFSVAAEEFGFIGSITILGLYLFLTYRGLLIAIRAPDMFSQLLVVGIMMLIIIQSFMNIGAMVGIIPLSGMPLLFISHGGSALLITLAEVGIILNISKYTRTKPKKH